ncbi:MAG: tetratricopeptide repeat protein [Verrucomicrobia bacterium]|nr:tetratricopeptide repeat protein [Verrucomicrobiota bacterium]
MTGLFPPDLHHFNAAQGWLELGNAGEASRELERVSAENQSHPDVLELRWELLALEKRWAEAADVADKLVRVAPARCSGWIHRSYALHELGRTREAWDKLLPAATDFPKVSTVPYNLACYACQLGHLDEAREWLATARRAGDAKHITEMARKDRDLEALWGEMGGCEA